MILDNLYKKNIYSIYKCQYWVTFVSDEKYIMNKILFDLLHEQIGLYKLIITQIFIIQKKHFT